MSSSGELRTSRPIEFVRVFLASGMDEKIWKKTQAISFISVANCVRYKVSQSPMRPEIANFVDANFANSNYSRLCAAAQKAVADCHNACAYAVARLAEWIVHTARMGRSKRYTHTHTYTFSFDPGYIRWIKNSQSIPLHTRHSTARLLAASSNIYWISSRYIIESWSGQLQATQNRAFISILTRVIFDDAMRSANKWNGQNAEIPRNWPDSVSTTPISLTLRLVCVGVNVCWKWWWFFLISQQTAAQTVKRAGNGIKILYNGRQCTGNERNFFWCGPKQMHDMEE